MVRPCSCPASKGSWQGAPKDKEHAMSQTPNTAIAVIGIDIGKNSFHVVGHDARGAIVLRQKCVGGFLFVTMLINPRCRARGKVTAVGDGKKAAAFRVGPFPS